jgi:hypothetical protein
MTGRSHEKDEQMNLYQALAILAIILFVSACTSLPAADPSAVDEPTTVPTADLPVPAVPPPTSDDSDTGEGTTKETQSVEDHATPATSSAAPPSLRGTFLVSNTSDSPGDVFIEALQLIVEVRQPPSGPWQETKASCTIEPAAPVVLQEELTVLYDCQLAEVLPGDAELRAFAEATLFGSDEPYRFEVAGP